MNQEIAFSPGNTFEQMRGIFVPERMTLKPEQFSSELIESGRRSQAMELVITSQIEKIIEICRTRHYGVGAWRKGSLNIITLIMRFARQLKLSNAKTRLRLMTSKIYRLINDSSADFNCLISSHSAQMRRRAMSTIYDINPQVEDSSQWTFLISVSEMIPIISLDSLFLKIYEMFLIVALILNITYIPLGVSFLDDQQSIIFNLIPEIYFITWMIVHSNTAFYKDVYIVEDRMSIFLNYIRKHLFFDIMVFMPYLLRDYLGTYSYISLIFKFKLLSNVISEFSEHTYLKENLQMTIDIIRSILFLVYTQHLLGCSFHFIGQYEHKHYPHDTNWIDYFQITDLPWQSRYITSIYWAVITSITVGYGDITPKSTLEQLFVSVISLVLCGALGFTITSIGEVLRQLNEKAALYKLQMKAIDIELKKRDLDPNLQLKVKRYYQQLFTLEQADNQLGEQLMTKLTSQLDQEVKIDSYKRFLKKALLLKYFKENTLNKLCTKVQVQKFGPGTEVIKSKSQSESLIFLIHGQLDVLASDSSSSITLKTLFPVSVIGEQQFAEASVYDSQMNSVGYSQIAFIKREDFYAILREDQEELEKFFYIRDQCLFNPERRNLVGQTCDICAWTHGYLKCPLAFLQVDAYQTIKQANRTQEQKRCPYRFRRNPKYNAIINAQTVEERAYEFTCNHKYEDDSYYFILLRSSYDIYKNEESFEQFNSKTQINNEETESKKSKNGTLYEQVPANRSSMNFIRYSQKGQKLLQPKSFTNFTHKASNVQFESRDNNQQLTQHKNDVLAAILSKLNNIDTSQRRGIMDQIYSQEEFKLQFDSMQEYKYYYPSKNLYAIVNTINKPERQRNKTKHQTKQLLSSYFSCQLQE